MAEQRKRQQWDDSIDSGKDFMDGALILADEDLDVSDDTEWQSAPVSPKTHFTELRRRIEDRIESKRIEHEFDYDD